MSGPSTPPRIIVIGSANIDLCMNLPELPAPGETLGGGRFRQTFGGKGANSAVAAAQAGGNVALVGCVGKDSNGVEMLANLRAKNVETTYVEEHPSIPTGVAFIFIDGHAQNMIGIAAGANDEVHPDRLDILHDVLKQADIIVVQNEVPVKTVRRLLNLAEEHQLRVLYNCAPALQIHGRSPSGVEWMAVNESEAATISGQPVTTLAEAEIAAKILLGTSVKNVLITLGKDGVYVASNNGKNFHVPAFSVKAVDTVGAGDTFCGALAVACGEGRELSEAVRFASAAAAISVTRTGAQNAAPHRDEIETFLKTNQT
jgi:ribokinase